MGCWCWRRWCWWCRRRWIHTVDTNISRRHLPFPLAIDNISPWLTRYSRVRQSERQPKVTSWTCNPTISTSSIGWKPRRTLTGIDTLRILMCTRGGTPSKNETIILGKWLIATTLVVLSQNFTSRGALFSVSSDGFTVVMVVKGYGNSSWDKGLPTGFICRALLHGNSRKYSVWQRLCREILGLGYMQICDWKISLEVA